jgi:hypothetical protein
MRKFMTMGGLALASAAFLLSACGAPSYRYSYYDRPYYSRAYVYDDCYGRYRPAYCSYPRFSGTVVIGGESYRGLAYRDGPYGREFWFDGRWVRA